MKHAHAPAVISRSMFSAAISLKCRHLRGEDKNKKGVVTGRKPKRTPTNKNKHSRTHNANGNQKDAEASNESPTEDMDQDKENSIEMI